MSDLGFLEKLLDGADVEWVPLGDQCKIETGKLNTNAAAEGGNFRFFSTSKGTHWIDRYRWDTEALLIAGNANVGEVKHFKGKFEAYQRTYVLTCFDKGTSCKYLYYVIKNNLKKYLGAKTNSAAMTYIVLSTLKDFPVPIPCPEEPEKSLAIQGEIVRILDSFTELTAELTAELELRKKQYNHYRDQLLTFEDGEVEWKTLSELVDTVTAPTKLNRSAYLEAGALPIVDQGMNFLAGYTNEDVTPVEASEYVIFGDHSEHIKFVDFAFVQGADGLKILRPKEMVAKFIFHAFTSHYRKEGNYKRHWSKAKETLIPVPFANDPEKSLKEQARIVAILDKFDTLTSSLSEGLPREIELRQKQYEYYRDLLLSFPKSADQSKAAA